MLTRAIVIAGVYLFALMAGPAAVLANDRGLYTGLSGGVNFWPEDSELGSQEAELDFDWAVAGALGYAFGNGIRLEGEIGYRPNDVDNITGVAGGSGDYDVLNFMANLLYDFKIRDLPFTPYAGVGIGVARVNLDGVTPVSGSTIDESDVGFAFQGILGAAYDVSENLSLTLDYKHLRVPDLSFDTNAGANIDSDYATNQIMIGLRYRFGAPPPPATPAAPPKPAVQPIPPLTPRAVPTPPPTAPVQAAPKEFIVFFDFDQSVLTPEALGIVQDAAKEAKAGGYARIVLTGHADRAGPAAYNVGLSQRRADSVKAELTRLGVSGADIETRARGETEPLVPTDDGVPEPQNRRVEILMQ